MKEAITMLKNFLEENSNLSNSSEYTKVAVDEAKEIIKFNEFMDEFITGLGFLLFLDNVRFVDYRIFVLQILFRLYNLLERVFEGHCAIFKSAKRLSEGSRTAEHFPIYDTKNHIHSLESIRILTTDVIRCLGNKEWNNHIESLLSYHEKENEKLFGISSYEDSEENMADMREDLKILRGRIDRFFKV